MRCREAKQWLCTQRDGDDLAQAEASMLQDHLMHCAACRAFEQQIGRIETLLNRPSAPPAQPGMSTNHIMQAIQQQQCMAQQLEDLRLQQRQRFAHWRGIASALAAILFFTLGSIPLLLFAITIIQTDLVVKALASLNGVIDLLIIVAQYLQVGLTLVTRDNWLLSGLAFAVVIMMGMWLRLMRHPQEA
jgi:hypothetical protein